MEFAPTARSFESWPAQEPTKEEREAQAIADALQDGARQLSLAKRKGATHVKVSRRTLGALLSATATLAGSLGPAALGLEAPGDGQRDGKPAPTDHSETEVAHA